MQSFYLAYIIIMFAAVGIMTALAYYSWQRHYRIFSLLLLFAMEWVLVTVIGILGDTPEWFLFWWRMRFIGSATVAVFYFLFVLDYTGRGHWLKWQWILLLFTIPIISQILTWTNDSHHLMLVSSDFVRAGIISVQNNEVYGAWYRVHSLYSYVLIIAGLALLVIKAVRSFPPYRGQAIWLIIGTLCTWLASFPSSMSLLPENTPSLQPLGFAVMSVVLSWALFRYKFLDIMPIARDRVFESMDDAVFAVDVQNRLIDLNPAGLALVNRPARDIVGQPIDRVFASWKTAFDQYKDTHEIRTEVCFERAGEAHYYDMSISPLYRNRNQLAGRLMVLHNINERKQMELERENLIAELDAYAHTVAHDLKNPLSVIIGYVEIMRHLTWDDVPESLKKHVTAIERNSHKMRDIIQELLLLASVRSESEVDISPLDMATILRDVQERFTWQIEEMKAEVIMSESWPVARGYAPWVEEVWANYISNAIKYGGSPPRLEIGATPQNGGVRFWVRDNGRGLTPEQQATLFQQFTRLERQRAEGQGLGLSIVQRIIHRLDGQVGVESEPGKGSLFYFVLPA